MARMSIDDKFPRDPRVVRLGKRFGWGRRETMGALIDVFQIVYDRVQDVVSEADIDTTAEVEGFAEAMIDVDLAEKTRTGVRIKGAADRIRYLSQAVETGRAGGRKSAQLRMTTSKGASRDPSPDPPRPLQGSGNPPDVVPDPVPDVASDVVPDPPIVPQGGRGRKKSQPIASESELASVRVVLDKLGAENHTAYRMAEQHVRLIVNQLRAGVTELELRAVVAHCSGLKRFQGDGREYLTPETLFGPLTISRYLDAARSAYSAELARAEKPPQLSLIDGGKP